MKNYLKIIVVSLFIFLFSKSSEAQFPIKNLNVVVFTADDLGPDGVGVDVFGGKVKGLTPNIDKIANASVKFYNAHVNSAICMPSRGIIATGRYGFNSLHHGFFHAPDSVPTMMESFTKSGYKIGILGKVYHSSAKSTTNWDYVYTDSDLGSGRSPQKFYERTKAFVSKCHAENKPFYFMINSHDPHRPFQAPNGPLLKGAEWPSKLYKPDEIFVPGFLPDLPEVRTEISHYYNSVKRLDDTFGRVIQALKESGELENTVIMFLSDNGISMPFSKANCYLKSTKTPFFVYYPKGLNAFKDKEHFISSEDLFPTIMEMIGAEKPKNLDGTSFLPLLKEKNQKGRKHVFTQIDYLSSNKYYPMRCVQDENFGYIFNPWSDGEKAYHNANEGRTFKAMVKIQESNPKIKERVNMFRYRNIEEFYDLKNDPNCLRNLANDKKYAQKLKEYKVTLRNWMKKHSDPLLPVFDELKQPKKMRSLLNQVYATRLKPGLKNSKAYALKVKEMKKHSFE